MSAEEAQEKNAAITQEKNSLLDQKALLLKNLEDFVETNNGAASLNAELQSIVQQLEKDGETKENEKHALLTELEELKERRNQLEEGIAELQREEALATCKVCMDRPVQSVLFCGHAVCFRCFNNLIECHICRQAITRRNPKKLYLI